MSCCSKVPRQRLDHFAPLVRELMEGAVELVVPIDVELKFGANWDEMTPWHEA